MDDFNAWLSLPAVLENVRDPVVVDGFERVDDDSSSTSCKHQQLLHFWRESIN